ncbi:hypothetical protein [Sphingomonas sp.]|uniref:hypothetical protein n=1 Tax=Sphingomonas sp. TaxID=28214 RepID=UPI002DF6E8B8|nr:hypothetical protein [Sphingomonas sp.]
MEELTIEALMREAREFAEFENEHHEPALFGVSDGKVIGTYLEQKFTHGLTAVYDFAAGNSASGIDLPGLNVDIKTTSVRQPQSSCPFRFARQKIYGLGYHLLVFVYEKTDNHAERTSNLNMHHVVFVDKARTADYQTSRGVREILANDGNADDLVAFFIDRNLPVDDISAQQLAETILNDPPEQGYLTISNALQWRLQYGRTLNQAGLVPGLVRVL